MSHPALTPGAVAVVTGAAAGIGLAAGTAFARAGLRVCLADVAHLDGAAASVAAACPGAEIMTRRTDVSDRAQLDALAAAVDARWGGTDILMNNAGIQPGSTLFGADDAWRRILETNLWGPIHGTHAFVPAMVARSREDARPRLVINTGSKQGITTPPGDPAYNVAKAGLKAFTEALQHELRSTAGCRVTAHLLIPGFVFTGLTANGRTAKPPGAWTPGQTVAFMLDRLAAGDFYILCPDNDVTRALDERRIAWAAGDIIENRPPLSRWHPDFEQRFADFVSAPGATTPPEPR